MNSVRVEPFDNLSLHQFESRYSPALLKQSFIETRSLSSHIAQELTAEDQVVQACADASPTKWHLAHTTWFFEELILKRFSPNYVSPNERFAYCFNSYYESLGSRHPRAERGLLTRPTAEEVRNYRDYVEEGLVQLLDGDLAQEALALLEIGIHHEQQHQELMLTDILALFAANPLRPIYRTMVKATKKTTVVDKSWSSFGAGLYTIGHEGLAFAYDNESPAHQVYLQDFQICDQLVTNADWLAFIENNGYDTPSLWLSDGFSYAKNHNWQAPGYWEKKAGVWHQMTLHGLLPVEPDRPVCHVSYYEADAFARWMGVRLPTEFEWERAAQTKPVPCRMLDLDQLVPSTLSSGSLDQLYGGVWEWTQSAYLPYPRYKPVVGPLGEYNAKFMCNQFVLRGGSCATPDAHIRKTYRNFFYPHQRWQFMGIRLGRDV